MIKKLKNTNAITLVALVVTIIVLIILAGVSINLVLGQNGVITKAREARSNFQKAAEEEGTQLNEIYAEMNNKIYGNKQKTAKFQDGLTNKIHSFSYQTVKKIERATT